MNLEKLETLVLKDLIETISRNGKRVILTARSLEVANRCVELGFQILPQETMANPELRKRMYLVKLKETGQVIMVDDWDAIEGDIIQRTSVRVEPYPSNFAAYIIPNGLSENESVWIRDIIEEMLIDRRSGRRRKSCEATWTGHSLDLIVAGYYRNNFLVG